MPSCSCHLNDNESHELGHRPVTSLYAEEYMEQHTYSQRLHDGKYSFGVDPSQFRTDFNVEKQTAVFDPEDQHYGGHHTQVHISPDLEFIDAMYLESPPTPPPSLSSRESLSTLMASDIEDLDSEFHTQQRIITGVSDIEEGAEYVEAQSHRGEDFTLSGLPHTAPSRVWLSCQPDDVQDQCSRDPVHSIAVDIERKLPKKQPATEYQRKQDWANRRETRKQQRSTAAHLMPNYLQLKKRETHFPHIDSNSLALPHVSVSEINPPAPFDWATIDELKLNIHRDCQDWMDEYMWRMKSLFSDEYRLRVEIRYVFGDDI